MNIKMAINSQLSTIESKKQTKQTSRTETESQIWRSFGGWSVGRRKGGNWRKGAGIQKYKLVGTEQTGNVKNSTGNGVAKEFICMTHGHKLNRGIAGGNGGTWQRGAKGKNWDNCNQHK